MILRHIGRYRAGLVCKVRLDLLDARLVERVDRVRGNVIRRDAGIAHDRDSGAHFFVASGTLKREREGVIRTHLVANLVDDVVDIKVVALRNAVARRCNAAAFLSIDTNAADAACVAAAARSTEHMADVVIGFANICRQRCL